MREFKPMVKMETTEPTVELKLKKGGAVEKKMARGGAPMGAMIGAPKGGMMAGAKPKKPSLAARRRAMMASGAAGAPSGRAEAMMAAMPAMKKGGEMESSKVHKAEMKELSGIRKKLTKHEDMPASKGHRGLKAGGSVKKFAEGGRVQHDGGPEQMKQGKKKPAGPVSINQLSGTYKKGGAVMMANGGVTKLGTSIVNKPLADNNTAARKAAEQKAAEQKAAAQKAAQMAAEKAAAQKIAREKAAADAIKNSHVERERIRQERERAAVQKAAAERAAAQKASTERAAADKASIQKLSMDKAAAQKASTERAAAAAKPQIAGLDPKTGRFAPGSMEYMAPQVTPMPMPSVSKMPQSGYGGDYGVGGGGGDGGMRRGGKVQNNRKNRGGAVC